MLNSPDDSASRSSALSSASSASSDGATRVRRVRAPRASLFTAGSNAQNGVSAWLYLAGLCVTLAALYAVNYGLDDIRFALLSYSLAITGYAFSYTLRVRQISLQSIQMPLIVCVGLLILANATGSGMGWMVPVGIGDNRAVGMQVLVAWGAIIQSFLLSNDASVLFACVPGMTMLALVSTLNPDTEIQNAFLVFIGAATFMMVHENYLRTRTALSEGRDTGRAKRLFGGQLQLAAACLAGALLLANIVAVPIRGVGQTLFEGSSINPLNAALSKTKQALQANLIINENNTLELAVGPTPESDTPLMRIQCERGLYWRGNTFSDYTGHSFENKETTGKPIGKQDSGGQTAVEQAKSYSRPDALLSSSPPPTFVVPGNELELSAKEMRDSRKTVQHVRVVGGLFSNLYGAAQMQSVSTDVAGTLYYKNTGALMVSSRDTQILNNSDAPTINVQDGATYDVVSQVPTQDETLLRAASSAPRDVPQAIRETYLQRVSVNVEDTAHIQQLVDGIVQKFANNYDRAQAIRGYIAARCKYNLQSAPKPPDRDVVAWFLLEKQEGYCDSFAAAMTVLCRYANIPARMASGFLSGDLQPDNTNTYLVREKHKHVWTEVFFPHIGWVPFDATEGTVDISDHSDTQKKKQSNFVAWLTSHGTLPPTLALAFLVMLGYVVRTEVITRIRPRRGAGETEAGRPPTNQQIVSVYGQTLGILARHGIKRLDQQTPDEYALRVHLALNPLLPALNGELTALTLAYTRFRYGREVATSGDVQEAQARAAGIQSALQSVKAKEVSAALAHIPASHTQAGRPGQSVR